jgi:hypothetical protein
LLTIRLVSEKRSAHFLFWFFVERGRLRLVLLFSEMLALLLVLEEGVRPADAAGEEAGVDPEDPEAGVADELHARFHLLGSALGCRCIALAVTSSLSSWPFCTYASFLLCTLLPVNEMEYSIFKNLSVVEYYSSLLSIIKCTPVFKTVRSETATYQHVGHLLTRMKCCSNMSSSHDEDVPIEDTTDGKASNCAIVTAEAAEAKLFLTFSPAASWAEGISFGGGAKELRT